MPEYIEREALIEHIKDLPTWDYIAKADGVYEKSTKYPEGNFNCDDVINSINNAPAADVVEVVRCCDCVHRQENSDIDNTCYLTCNVSWGLKGVIDPTDFCSYGERRCEE